MGNIVVQEQLKGEVSNTIPSPKKVENSVAYVRLAKFGEPIVTSVSGSKNVALAEEGSYFVNCNPTISTGVKLQGDTTTAWVATTPSILVVNNDQVGGKNITVDYVKLLMTAAGAGLAQLQAAVLIDNGNRYASGGTDVTTNTKNVNMSSGASSIAKVYYGATASAASGAVRQVGRAVVRGAIPVVNDQYVLSFGGDNVATIGADGTTAITSKAVNFPPVVIGPQQSLLIYLFAASMSTSPSCEYEIAWSER